MPRHPHLAHLRPFARQSIVYLTVVTHCRQGLLACQAAFDTLTTIWTRSRDVDGWFVGDFILMPDHVHLFARAAIDAKPLSKWMETWKSINSRQLQERLGVPAPVWQRDYFDRFLRSAESYSSKWDYVESNPVRARLCARPEDWPWRGRLCDLRF